jgi:hypothetical protein
MIRRPPLLAIASVALAISSLALTIQNIHLRGMLASLPAGYQSGRGPSGERFREAFAIGDSVLRLKLVGQDGRSVSGSALGDSLGTFVYFFKDDCSVCAKSWNDWRDYVDLNGYSRVVFISCNSVPPKTIPGLDMKQMRLYTISRDSPLAYKLPHVPQLLLVNRCGAVTGTYKSVNELPS